MIDRTYIVSRTLENKIAIAENNDQNTLWVTLDVLKEILALLKEQQEEITLMKVVYGDQGEIVGKLVRCKDCKHKEESVSPSWEAWCNRLHCGCDNDWFCADGEAKG